MAATLQGLQEKRHVTKTRDVDGQETYDVPLQVLTDSVNDDPDVVLTAPGLPIPGASYAALSYVNSTNIYAAYYGEHQCSLLEKHGSGAVWSLVLKYTTKPPKRCATNSFTIPTSEPPLWSGSAIKFTKNADDDKDGNAILNSAKQIIKNLTVDDNRPTLELSMNVAWIDLAFLTGYRDAINNAVWWGQPKWTIKCTEFTWSQKVYGTCSKYYEVRFVFELNPDTWLFKVIDEGELVLKPGGNAADPNDYQAAKDNLGERVTRLLDGNGGVLGAGANPVIIGAPDGIHYYQEKDFSTVGWPATVL